MSRRKLLSRRTITILFLIVLPFTFTLLVVIVNLLIRMGLMETLGLIFSGLLLFGTVIIGTFAFIFPFIWYIPYHTKGKPERYFEKTGFEDAVNEYRFSKKLFYAAVALYIPSVFGAIYIENILFVDSWAWARSLIFIMVNSLLASSIIVLAIRFALQYARKDFDFYWARAYFVVSSQKKDSIEKFKYLVEVLNTYNKFLERNLKLKIKDIMRIYSIMISASTEQQIMIRESIGKALEKDKLELARQLAELSNLPDKEQFLIKERTVLNQHFKDILTTIIPAIISIIGFIVAMLSQVGIVE